MKLARKNLIMFGKSQFDQVWSLYFVNSSEKEINYPPNKLFLVTQSKSYLLSELPKLYLFNGKR